LTPVCDNYKPFSPSCSFSNHFYFAISSDSHDLPQDLASCLPPHPYHHLHFTPNAALITSDTNLTAHSKHCFLALPPNSAGFSYITEGALFISAQLSTGTAVHRRGQRPLKGLGTDKTEWKQPNAKART